MASTSDCQAQLNNFAQLACLLCDAPVALLYLSDVHGDPAMAVQGWAYPPSVAESHLVEEVQRSASGLTCWDLPGDPRFSTDAIVQAHPALRACVGVPLRLPPLGRRIGALCVFDTEARPALGDKARTSLEVLGEQIVLAVLRWDEGRTPEKPPPPGGLRICEELIEPVGTILDAVALCDAPAAKTIAKAATRVLQTLTQLGQSAPLPEDPVQVVSEPFDVRECVEEAVAALGLPPDRLEVRFGIGQDHRILGDAARLQRLLRLLLQGPTPGPMSDKLVLTVTGPTVPPTSSGPPELTFEIHRAGQATGPLPHQASFEAYATLRLALARRLCGGLRGRLWAAPWPPSRAIARVTLPAPSPPVPSTGSSSSSVGSTHSQDSDPLSPTSPVTPATGPDSGAFGLSILVADDLPLNQRLMVAFLQRLGYTPDVVHNGLEVLDAFEHKYYDLVLTDVEMPVMDGAEATRRLRGKYGPTWPHIVGVTSSTSVTLRHRCVEAGMQAYLAKPIRFEEVRAVVDSVLEQLAVKPKRKGRLQRLLDPMPPLRPRLPFRRAPPAPLTPRPPAPAVPPLPAPTTPVNVRARVPFLKAGTLSLAHKPAFPPPSVTPRFRGLSPHGPSP